MVFSYIFYSSSHQMHLFDIDVPDKIRFQKSETLSLVGCELTNASSKQVHIYTCTTILDCCLLLSLSFVLPSFVSLSFSLTLSLSVFLSSYLSPSISSLSLPLFPPFPFLPTLSSIPVVSAFVMISGFLS